MRSLGIFSILFWAGSNPWISDAFPVKGPEQVIPESLKEKDIKSPEELHQLKARVNEKDPLTTERMARFLLDLGGDSNSYNSYTESSKAGNGLLNLNLDAQAVSDGIFKPDNIAIHVGQNFMNFASSTIAWIIAATLYSGTNSGRSLTPTSATDAYTSQPSGYSAPSTSYGVPSSPLISSPFTHLSNFLSKNDAVDPSSSYRAPVVSASSYPSSGALQQRSSEEKQPDIVYKITPPTVADVDEGQLQTIERLLEEEEEVLKGLSQRQKYEVYERAKAAIEHKHHQLDTSATSVQRRQLPQEDLPATYPTNAVAHRKPMRRRKKLVRKQQQPRQQY